MPRKPKPAPRPRTSLAQVDAIRRAMRAVDLLRSPHTRAELAAALEVPDRTCNGLLETMTDAGIPVLSEREGRTIVYRVEDERWLEIARETVKRAPSGTLADS